MTRRGAKVIIGCRRIEGLKQKIEATVPEALVDVFHLDLSLKETVLDFCGKVKAGHDKIHVLINNSAIVSRYVEKIVSNYFSLMTIPIF